LNSAARLRTTFHLTDAAAEWAGSALPDLFPEGLLLVPLPGGVTRLQGWLKAGRRTLAAPELRRLRSLGATGLRTSLLPLPNVYAHPHGLFPPLRLGPFVVVPAARGRVARPRAGTHRITLIQGQAFGSGRHESTRLMIQAIHHLAPQGLDVLDVGAGSGILGFACLHLGAARVTCVEMELAAANELRRNRALNGVAAGMMPVHCGRFPIKRLGLGRYPLVLANLVTPVLRALMPRLKARLSPGGTLLCSGIHGQVEAAQVLDAARGRGLKLLRKARLRGWHVLCFGRP
jgi:ribosomal protein L11 methylase PrmA